jgi:hypothetical protein
VAKLDYNAFVAKMNQVYGNMNLTEEHLKMVYQFYLDSTQPAIDDSMAWYKTVFIQD